MAGQGLALRMATLLTGLLECLGFAGVLFGWVSLEFVFKTEHYFEELCKPDAGLMGNATGHNGKARDCKRLMAVPRAGWQRADASSRKLGLVPGWQKGVGRSLPPSRPASLSVVKRRDCQPPLSPAFSTSV